MIRIIMSMRSTIMGMSMKMDIIMKTKILRIIRRYLWERSMKFCRIMLCLRRLGNNLRLRMKWFFCLRDGVFCFWGNLSGMWIYWLSISKIRKNISRRLSTDRSIRILNKIQTVKGPARFAVNKTFYCLKMSVATDFVHNVGRIIYRRE